MAMFTIFRRELQGYLNSPAFYIFLIVFVAFCGGLTFYAGGSAGFFEQKFARLDALFGIVPLLLLIFAPAIAMRLWAEEHKTGTVELLMTLPMRDWEAVVGKFLAALFVLASALACTFPIPYVVSSLADPKTPIDPGPVVTGYIGMLLMGSVFLSIANLVSALSKNQIVAFIMGVTFSLALYMVGAPAILDGAPPEVARVMSYVGIAGHLQEFISGVLDARSIIYFLSLVALMLFATVRVIESRRWR